MFAIRSIALDNFKSFKGSHVLEFPTKPGLYFLTGDNQAEPQLGSNGAGKSTLLDAIYWCLFGKTLRGLKAGDVVTWGESSCTVTIRFACGSPTAIPLTRKQNPNSLELNGKPVSQETLEKAIGLNPESFVYSVILPQFGQSFFELKPAEKLMLFSDIMGLDFWLDKSRQAAEVVETLTGIMGRINLTIHDATATLTAARSSLKGLLDQELNFRAILEQNVKRMGNELANLYEKRSKGLKKRIALNKDMEQLVKTKATKIDSLEHINKCKAHYLEGRDEIRTEQAVLTAALEALQASIDSLSGVGSVCSMCHQPVNASHLREEKRKLMAKLGNQRLKLGDLNGELTESDKSIALWAKKAVATTVEIDNLEKEIRDTKTTLAVLVERLERINEQAITVKRDLKLREADANPFTAMVAECQAKIHSIGIKLAKQKVEFEELAAKRVATEYWVSGFKRIRLFLIEETLRQLEIEVNNSLASLGLVDWRIAFDVERENKAGGVTKGFVVFVHCPSNPEPVRWESWSGGETQRLQLAGDFGLANLIMMQAGLNNTIEFYDEPSEHLSTEGLNDLAETLYERAINDSRTIYLVDHRIPDFGDFEGVIKITKTKEGSVIEETIVPTGQYQNKEYQSDNCY